MKICLHTSDAIRLETHLKVVMKSLHFTINDVNNFFDFIFLYLIATCCTLDLASLIITDKRKNK